MLSMTTLIKQSKPGNNKLVIILKPFDIYTVECLKEYIARTSTLWKAQTQLLLSSHKPR